MLSKWFPGSRNGEKKAEQIVKCMISGDRTALREILASVAVKLFIGAVWSWWIKRKWSEVVHRQLMISNRCCREEIVLINRSQKCFSLLTSIASVKEGGGQVLCRHMFSHYCRWCIEAEKAIRVWHSNTLRHTEHTHIQLHMHLVSWQLCSASVSSEIFIKAEMRHKIHHKLRRVRR